MRKSLPHLTRSLVLESALKILDEQGLAELSMRKLAATLHVEAMSLYNHVKDKQDLLNGLVDLVLSRIELPNISLPWGDRLEAIARNLYDALVQHPALVIILASQKGSRDGNTVLQGMDNVIAVLADSGLKPRQQVNAFRGLLAVCFGFVLAHTQGFNMTKELAQKEWNQWDSRQWDRDTLPHLASLAPYFLQTPVDDDFRFMLRAYLDALRTAAVEDETA